mmetsp:Transcript_14945/g.26186  ORF Transcript_14945/g.26186 Transcript_14945/m.26186 type:complete len:209 (+) Transcript_14945:64-690(+)
MSISISVVRPSGAVLLESVELPQWKRLGCLQEFAEEALDGQCCRLVTADGKMLQEIMTIPESGLHDGSVVTAVVDATARRRILRSELEEHKSESDCWIALNELVLALPKELLLSHPGGADIILQFAGTDASAEFESIYHTQHAKQLADEFIIGFLDGASAVSKHSLVSKQSDSFSNEALPPMSLLDFFFRRAIFVGLAALAFLQMRNK